MKPLTQLIVLMSGMVALVAVGIGGMVAIEWLRPEGHNAQLNTEIIGVITIVATQLFGYVKSVLNGQAIKQESKEVKQAVANQGTTMANKAADIAHTASELALGKKG